MEGERRELNGVYVGERGRKGERRESGGRERVKKRKGEEESECNAS